ncbi:MAG: glycosyltransferase family 2 protein [Candidatus Promineifilaceae bacterium]|nr:glycosyltransferase family 2 protein [Candidatus Promineifilaceae bacterium]
MTTLSVIIPAYNEEGGIAAIVRRVLATGPALQDVGVHSVELIVVDDGSADETAAVAAEIPGVRLIRHPGNRGYGAALKTGFGAASGDLLCFLDADGTYPPEHLPQLCTSALNGAELVIGSRMAGAASEMPWTRRLGNFFFARLLSMVGRQTVTDSASGMRVFRREILHRIYPLPDGLNLTPVMSTRAIHEGVRMVEVPIPYSERVGRSKLSVVRDGSVFLHSILWTALTYNPVRILGLLGLSGIGVSLLIGMGLVVARLQGVTALDPWGVAAVFTALVGAVTGTSLFALGITFNYLVSLFYKKPVRQGLFNWNLPGQPLERHFGWAGLLAFLLGTALGLTSLALGISGWPMTRLWLYLLAGALLTLTGVQLVIYWVLIRVLAELSQRDLMVSEEMLQYEAQQD